MRARIVHGYLVPAASLLPDRLLRFLGRHFPIGPDDCIGWSYWMDASYLRWCRADSRRNRANRVDPDAT